MEWVLIVGKRFLKTLKNNMKTRLEIIEFVKDYFENNPRSVNDKGVCVYRGPSGEKCAFSICCYDEVIDSFIIDDAPIGVYNVLGDFGFGVLLEDFRIEDKMFWRDIQFFHDSSQFWESNGKGNILTKEGEAFLETLIHQYGAIA